MIKRNYWYLVIQLDDWPNTNRTEYVASGVFSIRSWKRKSNEEVYESIRDEAIRLVRHRVDSGMNYTHVSVRSASFGLGSVLASEVFPIDRYLGNTSRSPFYTEAFHTEVFHKDVWG